MYITTTSFFCANTRNICIAARYECNCGFPKASRTLVFTYSSALALTAVVGQRKEREWWGGLEMTSLCAVFVRGAEAREATSGEGMMMVGCTALILFRACAIDNGGTGEIN